MADNFVWTYASWDKIRPALLPSTGLGEALKGYDKAKDKLEKLDVDEFLDSYNSASKALEKVDQTRELAMKKCGIAFKTCKKALQEADVSRERTALSNILGMCLVKLLDEVKPPLAKELIAVKSKNVLAEKTINNLKVAVIKANQEAQIKAKDADVKIEPKFLKEFFKGYAITLAPEELKLAKSVASGDNNFEKNQSYPNVIKTVELRVKAKWSVLKKIAPDPVIKRWEDVVKAVEQFQSLSLNYGQQLKQIKQLYGPFSTE